MMCLLIISIYLYDEVMVGNTGLQEILNPDFVKHVNVELLGHIKTEYPFEMKANLIKISDLTFSM